jgi:lipopolysaccharide biosynthesis glycosyltransferase
MFVDRNVLEHLQDKMIVDAPDLSDITDYLEPAIEKAKYRVILAVFGCDELPETLPKHLRFENTDNYKYIEDAEVLWCRYTALDYLNILVGVVHLIYIDTDTIITKDISSMIPEDIDEQHLYAVENKKIKNKDMWVSLCENTPSSIYNDFCEKYSFANGVFVMNLDHWYLNRYMDKMEEMMSTFPEPYIADTAILNMLYYDTYGKLDSKFNAMGLGIGKRYPDVFADSAYILHWTGPLKWWNDATNNHLVKSYYPENYDSYYMNKILQEDDII